jgi:ribose/xylose/arabinose/galactoside ABC-type transport system permease subunit
LAALLLLVLGSALFTPNFATLSNLLNILLQVSTAVLVGLGMTVVLATAGVDLSVGSIMAVASAAAAWAIPQGTIAAIMAGLVAAGILGAVNGVLVARFRVEPFIVTLAMLITARGLAQVVSNGGEVTSLENPTFENLLGKGYVGPIPAPVLLAAVVLAAGAFVIRATVLGSYFLAVGGNRPAARLAGVHVERTLFLAYLASGLLAGLAGLIETARLGATDPANIGAGIEFAAIAGAVIGGTPLKGGQARVMGTLVGILILAVIGTSFNMLLIPFAWTLILQASIILIAVAWQRPRQA